MTTLILRFERKYPNDFKELRHKTKAGQFARRFLSLTISQAFEMSKFIPKV